MSVALMKSCEMMRIGAGAASCAESLGTGVDIFGPFGPFRDVVLARLVYIGYTVYSVWVLGFYNFLVGDLIHFYCEVGEIV